MNFGLAALICIGVSAALHPVHPGPLPVEGEEDRRRVAPGRRVERSGFERLVAVDVST